MTDGLQTPALPDGMACFQTPLGPWVLTRNHEIARSPELGAFPGGQPSAAFDPSNHGGVSRLVLDPSNLRVLSSNLILTGTALNCSGGPSPWGYLTCEESEEDGHGWVFLCDPGASALAEPRPIPGYGRFRHEAVAIDPRTRRAYLTEDQKDGCLYRFTPSGRDDPFQGTLEAARAIGAPGFNTAHQMRPGDAIDLEWIEVPDPRATERPTRTQLVEAGALLVRRGEGIWFDSGSSEAGASVVFTATTGGPSGNGQVFRLALGSDEASPDRLELVAEAPPSGGMQFPDNVTIAPWGDPIVAEDGSGPQHLRGIRADGTTYALARNVISDSEFAGVCFSPDGSTLFCNLQRDGLTLAIRGPWEELTALPSS